MDNVSFDSLCSDTPRAVLSLISAFCWSTVYVYSIYLGQKEKTYCIPWPSLMINYSWELYFSFTDYQSILQRIINMFWAFLDTFIVMQCIVYGQKYAQVHLYVWYSMLAFTFFSGLAFIVLFQQEFDPDGGIAAFTDNYLMSILFIKMFYVRKSLSSCNDLEGQSIVIAVCKCIGTSVVSIIFCNCEKKDSILLIYIYIMIGLLDIFYIGIISYTMYTNKTSQTEKCKMVQDRINNNITSFQYLTHA
eukprot:525946_1